MYDLLSQDDVYNVHLATMETLERVGVLVEDPEALDLLDEAGAGIDRKEKVAKIPEFVLKEQIGKVPSSFVLYSRNRKKVRIGGDKTVIS